MATSAHLNSKSNHLPTDNSMNLTALWQKAQGNIREKVGTTSYETWFSNIQIKEKDSNTLIIETPDDFFKSWIIDHYQVLIKDILDNVTNKNIQIEFTVNSHILKEATQAKLTQFGENFRQAPAANRVSLDSRFTFENFVIGPSNHFACAACLAVAESPAKAYNPLLIYGPVGLGKTHLIQAIAHKIRKKDPHLKICYLSSEQFTNELIEAIRNRTTNQFKKKYREMDVLLIDDIQFIAGKEATEEEFFHTFNCLHENRKQIILTSDRPAKEMAKLTERLRSRFSWGLGVDIQPPNFETRVAILRKKLESEPLSVPDEVINFIAQEIKTNIRDLEGALIRVSAYALLEERPLTLDIAKSVLRDMLKESAVTINVESIQKAVAKYFQIPLSELRAKRRNKNIVLARQVAMYLSRKLGNLSLPEIGYAFGGKDHTTVLHSYKKIDDLLSEDSSLQNAISELTTTLTQ